MIFSFELDDIDTKFVQAYAEETGETIGEMAKRFMLNGVEDIMDLRAYKAAKAEYENDPTTYSTDEIRTILGIDQ